MKKIMARGLAIMAALVTMAAVNAMANPVHKDITSNHVMVEGDSTTDLVFSISFDDFVGYDSIHYRLKSGAFSFLLNDDEDFDGQEKLGYGLGYGLGGLGPVEQGVSDEINWNTPLIVPLNGDLLSVINAGNVLMNAAWASQGDFELTSLSFDGDVEPVPEPATMLLFGTGLAGLAGFGRKRRAKK